MTPRKKNRKKSKNKTPRRKISRREAPKFFGHFGPYLKAKSLCFGAKRQKILAIFGGDLKKYDPAQKISNI